MSADMVPAHGAAAHASTLARECSATTGSIALGKTDLFVEVESKGTEAGCSVCVKLDGTVVLLSEGQSGLGFNVVVINQLTGEVESATIYDTRSDPQRAEDLERELGLVREGRIIIAAICGETRNLGKNAKSVAENEGMIMYAFGLCGSKALVSLGYRCSYALLGVKGGAALLEQAGERVQDVVSLRHTLSLASDPEMCKDALKALQEGGNAQQMSKMALVLASAAQVSDTVRVQIAQDDGALAIVEAMGGHSESKEVQARGAMALRALGVGPATRQVLVDVGTIEALCHAIDLTVAKQNMELTFRDAVIGLLQLSLHPAASERILESNAVSKILAGFEVYPDVGSQEVALKGLARCLRHSTLDGISEQFMASGGCAALRGAMERHSEYPGILNTGIGLITALVLDETRKLQKVRNPGTPESPRRVGPFVELPTQHFSPTAPQAEMKSPWEAGGAEAVVKAMEKFGGVKSVVRCGCMALSLLVQTGEGTAVKVAKARGVTAVAQAIVDHEYSLDIARSALQTLDVIAAASDPQWLNNSDAQLVRQAIRVAQSSFPACEEIQRRVASLECKKL